MSRRYRGNACNGARSGLTCAVMRSRFLALAVVCACGNGNPKKPDAKVFLDGPPDTTSDVPIDAPAGCDYAEQHDVTNDYTDSSSFDPENTGVTFTASTFIGGQI